MKILFPGLLLLFLFAGPLPANAVSFTPGEERAAEQGVSTGIDAGSIICLFQSGTPDVRKEIHVSDVLPVYRENSMQVRKKVGTIRILSYSGTDYLKAVVLDGSVMEGDIAAKSGVASLVISASIRCPD